LPPLGWLETPTGAVRGGRRAAPSTARGTMDASVRRARSRARESPRWSSTSRALAAVCVALVAVAGCGEARPPSRPRANAGSSRSRPQASWVYDYDQLAPAIVNLGTRGEYAYFVTVGRTVIVAPNSSAILVESLHRPPVFASSKDERRWLAEGQESLPSMLNRPSFTRVDAGQWTFAPFDAKPLTIGVTETLPTAIRALRKTLTSFFGPTTKASERFDVFDDYAFLLASAPIKASVRRSARAILQTMADEHPDPQRPCFSNRAARICVNFSVLGRVTEIRWWLVRPSWRYPGFGRGRLIERDIFHRELFAKTP
jgi:hypothetical protein